MFVAIFCGTVRYGNCCSAISRYWTVPSVRGGLNVRRETAIVLFRIEIDFFRFRYEIVQSLAFAFRVQYSIVLYPKLSRSRLIAIVTVLSTVQYCTVPEKRKPVIVLFRIEIEKNRFRYEIVQLLFRVGHLAHPSPMVQSSTLKSRYSNFRTGLYQKRVLVTNQPTNRQTENNTQL